MERPGTWINGSFDRWPPKRVIEAYEALNEREKALQENSKLDHSGTSVETKSTGNTATIVIPSRSFWAALREIRYALWTMAATFVGIFFLLFWKLVL